MERGFQKIQELEKLFECVGNLYLWTCTPDWTLLESNCSWEAELRNIFLLNGDHRTADQCFEEGKDYIQIQDSLYLTWIILTQRDDKGIQNLNYILGPVFTMDISRDNMRTYMNEKEMSVSSQIRFLKLLNDIPVMGENAFRPYGRMLYYTVTGKQSVEDQPYQKYLSAEPSETDALKKEVETVDFHGTYEVEQELLHNIESGNIESFSKTRNTNYGSVGIMSPGNPMRQLKDSIIVLAALATRAAIRGHLAPETAYTLSDYYIQRIEAVDSMSDLYELSLSICKNFTQRVHDIKNNGRYSAVVMDFISLIQRSIPGKVDLEKIAKQLGYAPYYLTRCLKQETGKSFKEVVKEEQIRYAKRMLRDPYTQITDLSMRLGFTSLSYFSAFFRKATGMTPTEYQKTGEEENAADQTPLAP